MRSNVLYIRYIVCFFFFKQKTAYEMRISDWSSDVCSSDLPTISPRQSDIENENLDNTKTPEGLDPLRPEVEPTPVSDLPEMIMTDIEAEHGRSAEDGNPNPAELGRAHV